MMMFSPVSHDTSNSLYLPSPCCPYLICSVMQSLDFLETNKHASFTYYLIKIDSINMRVARCLYFRCLIWFV